MKLSNLITEIKWAGIFIGFTLFWLLLEKVLGFHDVYIEHHPVVSSIFVVPAILIYVFALLEKRKHFYEGVITYKQGVISGLIISLIVTLFIPVTQSIISFLITPDYFTNAINYSVDYGEVSREEAEAYFNLKSYIIQGMIATPIIGGVTSLIVMIFVRKSK